MKIFILTMWIYGSWTPLPIGAFSSEEKCEADRPHYVRPYSFGICQVFEVDSDAISH